MQLYKEMNIVTAKPSKEELSLVEHKLIDLISINENFSVADYKIVADQAIEDTHNAKKIPILVGGTGLYVDSILHNTTFSEIKEDINFRSSLEAKAKQDGNESLFNTLLNIDPQSAEKININDTKRIIRALEVYHLTGKTLSQHNLDSHLIPPKYDFLIFNIIFNKREALYDRINRRVDKMLDDGLLNETKILFENGLLNTRTASQAIGYKEFLQYLNHETDYNTAVELLKRRTRNYAKRQITWFKKYNAINLIADEGDIFNIALLKTQDFLNS